MRRGLRRFAAAQDAEVMQSYTESRDAGDEVCRVFLHTLPRIPNVLVDEILENVVHTEKQHNGKEDFQYLMDYRSSDLLALCANTHLTDGQHARILDAIQVFPDTIRDQWSSKKWDVSGDRTTKSIQRGALRSLLSYGRLAASHPVLRELLAGFKHWPLPAGYQSGDESGEILFGMVLRWDGHTEESLLSLWTSADARFRSIDTASAGLRSRTLPPKVLGVLLQEIPALLWQEGGESVFNSIWQRGEYTARWVSGNTQEMVNAFDADASYQALLLSTVMGVTPQATWPPSEYCHAIAMQCWEESPQDFIQWALHSAPVEMWRGVPATMWSPVLAEPSLTRETRIAIVKLIGRISADVSRSPQTLFLPVEGSALSHETEPILPCVGTIDVKDGPTCDLSSQAPLGSDGKSVRTKTMRSLSGKKTGLAR